MGLILQQRLAIIFNNIPLVMKSWTWIDMSKGSYKDLCIDAELRCVWIEWDEVDTYCTLESCDSIFICVVWKEKQWVANMQQLVQTFSSAQIRVQSFLSQLVRFEGPRCQLQIHTSHIVNIKKLCDHAMIFFAVVLSGWWKLLAAVLSSSQAFKARMKTQCPTCSIFSTLSDTRPDLLQ